jgi:putative selenate reductase
MSDKMYPLSIEQLASEIRKFQKRDQLFGIFKSQFFKPSIKDSFRRNLFGKVLAAPIGPAAGPHTQMTQNIISAWLCGARYIELKTVQTLDEIEVTKPCIDMEDEGYNCEWSQELTLRQSAEEYIKAWVLIHLLHHILDLDGEIDTIFNLSVGYNLEGILKGNVQWFLKKMSDAEKEIAELKTAIRPQFPEIDDIEIPAQISDNITLSTMHGCPPDEIEKIGLYLIKERKLHTYIKLNPTLLGREAITQILNEKMGFESIVPAIAFEHDISYDAAKSVIRSLQKAADETGVDFGVKLTNTLEVLNHKNYFKDQMMYLSGKALHPISIQVAKMIRNDFPELSCSFSAGVNALNVADVLNCGLSPATTCSDLLKPGGYTRLGQYIEKLRERELLPFDDSLSYINIYANKVLEIISYMARRGNIKTGRILGEYDCIAAPCESACPTHQQIPEYLFYSSKKDFPRAFQTILNTNPFPSVTGMVCDHACQSKCTRMNYDDVLLIRDVKRCVAENVSDLQLSELAQANGKKAAIIGAGPAGLSCAYYLKMAGFDVEVYESKSFIGGMLADAIPHFRLSEAALQKDLQRITNLGIKIHTNARIGKSEFSEIRRAADFVFLAVGAQAALKAGIPGEDINGVLDPLKFLSELRQKQTQHIGKEILVIGGGNTAMDVARTALRLAGKDAKVRIVYRRTQNEMPADQDEIQAALLEGVVFLELIAPVEILQSDGKLIGMRVIRMELGEKDSSGRRRPIPIPGTEFILKADTIIPAIGQKRKLEFIDNDALILADSKSRETITPGVFLGGDALHGAANIIGAIADGRYAAQAMLQKALGENAPEKLYKAEKSLTKEELYQKKARIEPRKVALHHQPFSHDLNQLSEMGLNMDEAVAEAGRCLFCDELCDVCVTVCPNRALQSIDIEPFSRNIFRAVRENQQTRVYPDGIFQVTQKYQVIHIEDLCNECGNCATFCPTAGAPYKDKPHLSLRPEGFDHLKKGYYLANNTIYYKENGQQHELQWDGEYWLYSTPGIEAVLKTDFSIKSISIHGSQTEWSSKIAIKMWMMLPQS